MIRSLVKQGLKRVLRMETRPAEYGGPTPVVRAPVPAPAPVTAVAPPEPEPPTKKPRKPRAKKAVVEEASAPPPSLRDTSPSTPSAAPPPSLRDTSPPLARGGGEADDVAGPALDATAVQVILDEMVRPALQGDGGDITLLRIENNDIYVKLVGSCSTCPSSILTMKAGVEALLKEEFPSMNQLIQVD